MIAVKGICQATSQRLKTCLATLTTGLYALGFSLPGFAQVTSDGTTSTVVNPIINNNIIEILKGRQEGSNLFHSFRDFSVPQGMEARFNLNNTSNITTIFSRVTGGNVSNIDGTISIVGNPSASLFLLNPAGIIFGQNAKLDIGGSFVGTTANSIKFSDGTEFSAVNPSSTSLLTMSVPIGLQMGQNPGNITVLGTGHKLTSPSFGVLPTGTQGNSELRVNSGHSLGLIGGSIALDGGVLSGEAGQIELHAVGSQNQNSLIKMAPSLSGWNFDSSQITNFAPILLKNYALIDASGNKTSSINLNASKITVDTGSWIFSVNQGDQTAGRITLNATESFALQGAAKNGRNESRIVSEARGSGGGADIQLTVPVVNLYDLTLLTAISRNKGDGGNITIRASDSVQLQGLKGEPPSSLASRILTVAHGAGQAGYLSISTQRLTLLPGGRLSSTATSTGRGGNINVDATESIEINAVTNEATSIAGIASENFGSAKAGDILLKTSRLSLQNGAYINSTNLSRGTGGTITLNASDRIEVQGHYFDRNRTLVKTLISASTTNPSSFAQSLFNLDPIAQGDSGNIMINTPQLSITDQASVSTANLGIGKSGLVMINSDRLSLDNQGSILAVTNAGGGGDIRLNLQELLIMRRGSSINTKSLTIGNAGNITINSPIIVGLENSDIIANAVQDNGGNINITTQGIIGLQFRNTLTPREDLTNDITASSQFNVNGSVQINNIGVDPNSGLIELPANVTDSSQQIASGCEDTSSSSFVATGRGGLPQNPMQEIESDRPWSDVRNLTAFRQTQSVQAQIPKSPQVLVQATSWRRRPDGKVELIATQPSYMQPSLTCANVATGSSKLF
jgi:filamentous hemagglutinin family protein